MRPKYEEIILLSTPMENTTVVQLYSFFVVYPQFLVVYLYEKQ